MNTWDASKPDIDAARIAEEYALLDRTKPFVAYISTDASHVTGWHGNTLGVIKRKTTVKLPRRSDMHGTTILAVRVRDMFGYEWHGRGSPGMSINLRACTSKKRRVAAPGYLFMGDREPYPVATFAEASQIYATFRDANDSTVRDIDEGELLLNGQRYRISYNAKIWPNGEWTHGLQPVYDPYKEVQS